MAKEAVPINSAAKEYKTMMDRNNKLKFKDTNWKLSSTPSTVYSQV